MTKALLFSLETCIVQIQSVWVNFACTKKTFVSLGRSDFQCPQCGSVCQVRVIPFEEQINSFFLSLDQGVYIFGEIPKSVQEVIGDVYCPAKSCLKREKCKSIGGYVTTPRSIYGCDNCGAWLFVHKVPFKLQEHVKTTKTDKTRFFFAKKDVTMLPDKQLFINAPFQSTKYGKKELCVDNKVRETIGDVYFQHVEMKSVFTFQPKKQLVSTTVKSARPAVTF